MMATSKLRTRFWVEATLGTMTAVFFILTIVWEDWVEIVSGWEPDNHSGELEWFIAGGFLVATVIFALAARHERRRHISLAGAAEV
jgi:hypothetical protein